MWNRWSRSHALASYLISEGHNVFRDPRSLLHLETPIVHASGEIEGQFELGWAGTDPQHLTANCPTIFVCTKATAYLDVVNQLAPYLQPEQEIVLFSSKLGGSLEVEHELYRRRRQGVRVLETDALFACRLQADKSIWIRGFKEWTLFSAPTCSQTEKFGSAVLRFFPKLQPAQNLIQRGLTGAIWEDSDGKITGLVRFESGSTNNLFSAKGRQKILNYFEKRSLTEFHEPTGNK